MIFVRHPVTAAAPGLCYGRLDVEVSEVGGRQIVELLEVLPQQRAIVSSPAIRCATLASAIAERDRLSVIQDLRLQEMDFGAWEGCAWDVLPRDQTDHWAADPWDRAPPGGETFSAMFDRVAEALATAPPDALVVTHAGVIRAARMILGGASFDQVFSEAVPYCTPITIIEERL
jgi:alpha-ribazole phosphatase